MSQIVYSTFVSASGRTLEDQNAMSALRPSPLYPNIKVPSLLGIACSANRVASSTSYAQELIYVAFRLTLCRKEGKDLFYVTQASAKLVVMMMDIGFEHENSKKTDV